MSPDPTLLLSRSDIAAVLGLDECMAAVEHAFARYADGSAVPPGVLGVGAQDGVFHVKAGRLDLAQPYFATKVNGNFPRNRERYGLPTIQGILVLCDGATGQPLALMDSMEITTIRTGAATGVATRYLARADACVAAIVGCGMQGRVSLRAIARVRRLSRVRVFDVDAGRARLFADEMARELGIAIEPAADVTTAVGDSDICVTCTTSERYFLERHHVVPGTFVAAVGADNEHKQEIEPALLAASKVVTDVTAQCAAMGELHHALEAGTLARGDVHAELGEIILGEKAGREHNEEIIVFDSTGMALQDVTAAALVYEQSVRDGRGRRFAFDL